MTGLPSRGFDQSKPNESQELSPKDNSKLTKFQRQLISGNGNVGNDSQYIVNHNSEAINKEVTDTTKRLKEIAINTGKTNPKLSEILDIFDPLKNNNEQITSESNNEVSDNYQVHSSIKNDNSSDTSKIEEKEEINILSQESDSNLPLNNEKANITDDNNANARVLDQLHENYMNGKISLHGMIPIRESFRSQDNQSEIQSLNYNDLYKRGENLQSWRVSKDVLNNEGITFVEEAITYADAKGFKSPITKEELKKEIERYSNPISEANARNSAGLASIMYEFIHQRDSTLQLEHWPQNRSKRYSDTFFAIKSGKGFLGKSTEKLAMARKRLETSPLEARKQINKLNNDYKNNKISLDEMIPIRELFRSIANQSEMTLNFDNLYERGKNLVNKQNPYPILMNEGFKFAEEAIAYADAKGLESPITKEELEKERDRPKTSESAAEDFIKFASVMYEFIHQRDSAFQLEHWPQNRSRYAPTIFSLQGGFLVEATEKITTARKALEGTSGN